MEKATLTVEELSKYLSIGRNNAYILARFQGFPSVRIGKRLLVPVRDLESWLSEQAKKGGSDERV